MPPQASSAIRANSMCASRHGRSTELIITLNPNLLHALRLSRERTVYRSRDLHSHLILCSFWCPHDTPSHGSCSTAPGATQELARGSFTSCLGPTLSSTATTAGFHVRIDAASRLLHSTAPEAHRAGSLIATRPGKQQSCRAWIRVPGGARDGEPGIQTMTTAGHISRTSKCHDLTRICWYFGP